MDDDGSDRRYLANKYTPDVNDIEEIIVRPSTELIPDEYEHEDNKQGLVLIFYSVNDVDNKNLLQKALSDQGYNVSEDNIHLLQTKQTTMDTLEEVSRSIPKTKTCLILIFMGNIEKGGQFLPDKEERNTNKSISVKEVWSHFTGNKCLALKYKPKIFIFQAFKKPTRTHSDGMVQNFMITAEQAYDIPAEADMAIIYKTVDDMNRNDFMEQLCNNFADFGFKEDIFNIVTYTDHDEGESPLVISTLTRKFYVSSSTYRGHHHDLYRANSEVFNALKNLHDVIHDVHKMSEQRHSKQEHTSTNKCISLSTNVQSDVSSTNATLTRRKRSKKSDVTKRPPWR